MLVRLTIAAAPLGILGVIAVAADGSIPTLLVAVVTVVALLAAALPDSNLVALELVIVVWAWLRLVGEEITPWTVLAAALVLCVHTAAAYAAAAPLGASADRPLTLQWLRRIALVTAATGGVALGAWAFQHVRATGNALLLGLALATVSVVVAVALASSGERDAPEPPEQVE